MRDTITDTLRLFFHNTILNGVDASVLISSTPFNKAEHNTNINLSLPRDAFNIVTRAKTALELNCPNTVDVLFLIFSSSYASPLLQYCHPLLPDFKLSKLRRGKGEGDEDDDALATTSFDEGEEDDVVR
ncbi:hypothetical protein QYF36_022400 [Acer negundo]|nr:hypothetical protein QYF36_022400 [Acer negundo]